MKTTTIQALECHCQYLINAINENSIHVHYKINIYENKKHYFFYDTNSFSLWM